jgi:5S rRNA maturation endonuclease (ribonuclease M5)
MMQPSQKQTAPYKPVDIHSLKESVDLHNLLYSLGFKITNENSREIRCTCIVHGGDNKSAFRINKDKRTWICFTHKCHEEHGYDIIGLIKGVLNTDFIGALDHLKKLVGDNVVNASYMASRKFSSNRDSFIKEYSQPARPDYVSEDHLRSYRPLRSQSFTRDDNFSKETLDYFEVAGGFTDKFNILRDIIPIRDVNGELQAYSLKDVRRNPPDTSYKYIITEGFIKDQVLYNMHSAKIYAEHFPIIVVEGFKSVWRLYDYGIYNVVAAIGSFITEGQMKLLKAHAQHGVVVMFDADEAGKTGADLAKEYLGKEKVKTSIVTISQEDIKKEDDGPAELTVEQVYGYLNEYIR